MSTDALTPLYSRLDPEMTARTRRKLEEARATKAQSALEYVLFAVFGATILIAAIALVITNSSSFRSVPNLVEQGKQADRVNVLVMQTFRNGKSNAIGTDALLLVSVKPSTHEVAVTSIPRDLFLRLGKYGERRLGAAPAVGKSAGYPGEGAGLTADTVSSTLGQQVHAYVHFDRGDLMKAVDAVGGIDVDIDQSFLEFRTHNRFLRGRHHLNGREALLYAVSPYVLGPANERSAREARQQQVVAALTLKAASDPSRIQSLPFSDHTNLEPQQAAWLGQTIANHTPRYVNLEQYMDTFQVTTFADSGEVVRPHDGSFAKVRSIVANVFS